MFCPRCGRAEQLPETFCRQCGLFLPDLSKPFKSEAPPEEHLKANTVLNSMTVIASFTLAILLYVLLGFRTDTHPLIYVTAGILTAIGGWHIQTLIRTLKLKKQWKRRAPLTGNASPGAHAVSAPPTAELLPQANFADTVPVTVTEDTTRHLAERSKPNSI